MKKLLIYFIAGVIALALSRVVVLASTDNYYNTWTNEITCTDHCLHEIGHKLDDLSGWVSRTPEWRNAVPEKDLLIFTELTPIGRFFIPTKNVQYTEMYAIYLERYNANFEIMPKQLRPFYDQDLLNQIMQQEENKNAENNY